MKFISYQREIPAVVITDPDGNNHIVKEAYLQTEELRFTYTTKDIQIAEALKHSYNGEYTIEDNGEPEPAPTQLDRIESQITYTAMMTDTLLEG